MAKDLLIYLELYIQWSASYIDCIIYNDVMIANQVDLVKLHAFPMENLTRILPLTQVQGLFLPHLGGFVIRIAIKLVLAEEREKIPLRHLNWMASEVYQSNIF